MRTVRRVIAGGRFEPYVDEHGVEVVPGPRDARERVRWALSGVSAELARLDWAWPDAQPFQTFGWYWARLESATERFGGTGRRRSIYGPS